MNDLADIGELPAMVRACGNAVGPRRPRTRLMWVCQWPSGGKETRNWLGQNVARAPSSKCDRFDDVAGNVITLSAQSTAAFSAKGGRAPFG